MESQNGYIVTVIEGRDFESQTIKELCKIAGIRKIRTTLYHPEETQSNALIERY